MSTTKEDAILEVAKSKDFNVFFQKKKDILLEKSVIWCPFLVCVRCSDLAYNLGKDLSTLAQVLFWETVNFLNTPEHELLI